MIEETKKIGRRPKLYLELERKFIEEQIRPNEYEKAERLH